MFDLLRLIRRSHRSALPIAAACTAQSLWALQWALTPTPRLLQSETVPLPQPLSDPAIWRELADRFSGKKPPLSLVLPATAVKLLQLNAPDLPPDERRAALTFLAAQAEERPSDSLVVDYLDVPALRRPAAEPLAYCAVAERALVTALIDAIPKAGFALERLDIPEQALRRLLAHLAPEVTDPQLILYCDDEGALIIAATTVFLYLFRTSRIGRRLFAADPASGAMALGLDIQRTLDFFESQFTDPVPQTLWVIDAVTENRALCQALQNELRVTVVPVTVRDLIGAERDENLPPLGIIALTLGAALPHTAP